MTSFGTGTFADTGLHQDSVARPLCTPVSPGEAPGALLPHLPGSRESSHTFLHGRSAHLPRLPGTASFSTESRVIWEACQLQAHWADGYSPPWPISVVLFSSFS